MSKRASLLVMEAVEFPRAALTRLVAAMADTPVVAINGARQVGKSTLARQLLQHGGQLVTLDDQAQRAAAAADPRGFVERDLAGPLIIDEVQYVPELFRAVKAAVDRDRRPGRFVLTGSTRLLSQAGFADALVGRVEIVELWPLSQGELRGRVDRFVDCVFDGSVGSNITGASRAESMAAVLQGGFPEVASRIRSRRGAWFDSYLRTLTETVVRDLSGIERVAEMPRVIRLCAARSGLELNVTNLASELTLPPRTLDGYLATLANLFVLQLIPAWSTNVSKKVIRRPKMVLADSGLAARLVGLTEESAALPTAPLGPILESFVAMELRKQLSWSSNGTTLWHFRDRDGIEVDFVLERPDGSVVAIEVKASSTVTTRDTKGLRFLSDRLGDRFKAGVVVSFMPEPTPLGPKLSALPLQALWAEY